MSAPTIGQVFYFGHRQTRNVVTRVLSQSGGGFLVEMQGPRGGKYMARVKGERAWKL